MKGKITLITPPDVFENTNLSLLFIHINDQDQVKVSEWFGRSQIEDNVNVYFYSQEEDAAWLLYAVNAADYKIIDIDHANDITKILNGHLLSKNNFFYVTKNEAVAQICKHINSNRITNIDEFLEKALNGKGGNQT